ncbi:enolase C-terminal domain-like protein [Chitinophaga japonensis]|uniref:L-alanine-DL-glutamate epimerase-like enolase superfamily enzyme n=1 Tax=Chitinophaga japonensis TaxID=104662 RepID=A0A562SUT5_CHIJA|nr:enolase C-terminal domain-like protein [Chitinophaga japonensis]TWI84456.1 L-alanine-DL-glutamate epimerase-like enolase superfamily enzyme [Chitinophaga japonensis]
MKDQQEAVIRDTARIRQVKARAYRVPAETPEADGTLEWESTTLVLVEIQAGSCTGIGYTYSSSAAAGFINSELADLLLTQDALQIPHLTQTLIRNIRNNGNCGLAMMAVSAVDTALWDLKARMLELPLCRLLGQAKDAMPVYGSGGFTDYTRGRLQEQLGGWAAQGISSVKMKTGADPELDVARVRAAREAVGPATVLFVDANGAYTVKQALDKAARFAALGVTWLEEPVSSDNLEGLRFIRERAPAGMNIAAGEYAWNLACFRSMLQAGAVDVLQADATRCGGISGFLKAGHLCEAAGLPFSSHCAPALHLHAALALPSFFTGEYFYDHARIERMLFDGVSPPRQGCLLPDLDRPGLGLTFKHRDAEKFLI